MPLPPKDLSRRRALQQTIAAAALWQARGLLGQQGTMPMDHGDHDHTPPGAPQAQNGMAMAAAAAPAVPLIHSLEMTPFVDALPLPKKAVLSSSGHMRLAMREIHAKVHRDLPPTRFWRYVDISTPAAARASAATGESPLIEVHAHQPLQIEWRNELPAEHFLPIDYSLHGCGRDLPQVRGVVHVHGARVPTRDDGHPEDWYPTGKSLTCTYPWQQAATALWYHDHAMGLNRLNMYAGLFGQLWIRDAEEAALHLPAGKYEVPLTLYDRDFTTDGQLFYPTSGDPDHPWVPEFAADAILINGKLRPYFDVEPRVYRFRLLNAANSRFFRLSVHAPSTEAPATARDRTQAVPFQQIGADQGLLAAPAALTTLNIAPGERADLLVDFSAAAGQTLHLRNSAFDILQFRVAQHPAAKQTFSLPSALRAIDPADTTAVTVIRTITLNEYQDKVGTPMVMLLNRTHWHEPVTETPKLGSTEIWEFVNLTEDTHPMHLHLVRFRILDRRTFEPFDYLMHKQVTYTGAATPPEANESGWKDVVQCPAGTITRILVKFEGYTGRYLYHCHILEHEANDMMRPFDVIA